MYIYIYMYIYICIYASPPSHTKDLHAFKLPKITVSPRPNSKFDTFTSFRLDESAFLRFAQLREQRFYIKWVPQATILYQIGSASNESISNGFPK